MDVTPAEMLREALTKKGWKQADLAMVLGVPPQTISLLCRGRLSITARRAKQLEAAFGIEAIEWLKVRNGDRVCAIDAAADRAIEERASLLAERKAGRPAPIRVTFAHLLAEAARMVAVMGEPTWQGTVERSSVALTWTTRPLDILRIVGVNWQPADGGTWVRVRAFTGDERRAELGDRFPDGRELNDLRAWLDGGPVPGWCR